MIFIRTILFISELQPIFILLFCIFSLANSQSCPPKDSELKPITNFLNGKLGEIRKLKVS